MFKQIFLIVLIFSLLPTITSAQSIKDVKSKFSEYILHAKLGEFKYQPDSTAKLDTVAINKKTKKVYLFLGKQWEYKPVRREDVEDVYTQTRKFLGNKYAKYDFVFFVGKTDDKNQKKVAKKNKWPQTPKCELADLVPNIYRYKHHLDQKRNTVQKYKGVPHIQKLSKEKAPSKGLYNNHLAIWNSHGWYYEKSLDRWEWQRARLFQTVEDLLPTAFVLPYLVPMLENAGANVYLPRERDTQSQMLIVDNDGDRIGYTEKEGVFAGGKGFNFREAYSDENPFAIGTYRKVKSTKKDNIVFEWKTEGKIKGEFSVYISYATLPIGVDDARYVVKHQKQQTTYLVNQKIGGGTWVYLGTFKFDGSPNEGVFLSSKSKHREKIITADAVRFGGGTGNIKRGGATSGRPRFMEGSRYHLQYAGAPLEVYTPKNEGNDYKDDYQSRGEWVNWLTGAPFAINPDVENNGLNVPIDLALALHTDSGVSDSDTTKGTLLIYSTTDMKKNITFPNGQSRYTNRDLADIIQTQIVTDLRVLHDSIWNRRELWDRRYSEAVYPNVPTVLVELLSHQNFKDMRFALDPQFRFDVSRAIYKGIVKYLSYQENRSFVIQPLKPKEFAITLKNQKAFLQWKGQLDSLESTAVPSYYKLYTNRDNQGWDAGKIVYGNNLEMDIEKSHFYRFKIAAVNDGGESFTTEELSIADFGNKPVLIVNGFDRIGAPSVINTPSYKGFTTSDDGIADGVDISFTGNQYDYNPNSEWLDDDAPGHGASYADAETILIRGNTHDFTRVHGEAFYYLKQSFVSVSIEAIEKGLINLEDYEIVDVLFGEQKSTETVQEGKGKVYSCFSNSFKEKLATFLSKPSSKLFISGAYIGTDLFEKPNGLRKGRKHKDVLYAKKKLHFIGRTNYADKLGTVFSVNPNFKSLNKLFYANTIDTKLYRVEAPDALDPADKSTKVIGRYTGNNKSIGIAYSNDENRIVALGFPFETITSEQKRIEFMEEVIKFFK
ncbi:golvesin C-terminal-like domain-containing protein [Flammeovirga kamogawensis]|uniref:N-acetylmuramoyl-L-alanine amidase n=1 Tax=Flammeovirga kamogawensis TaxID=373891 RepID=A0ABX8GY45_9BACT|nr:N-acetylmuramoyl-L-alanine amidase [Flammeovirga kamogawensis]MBB6460774.1 hypothetical protein [Flammeovirga kamogawensis]QWG08127.1 N-acetylmuramoyl-L-alanine amidase [Flammeovirga kamogawensis]TRX69930.1 xanthan lyase [Flammeovirga kamogawensis]